MIGFVLLCRPLEELLSHHSGARRDHVGKLRDFGELVSAENEMKCWDFLDTRCSLLLKAYPQTSQVSAHTPHVDLQTQWINPLTQLRLSHAYRTSHGMKPVSSCPTLWMYM